MNLSWLRVYAVCGTSIVAQLAFTVYLVAPERRVRYFVEFATIEILVLCALTATTPSTTEIVQRLQAYGPGITSICIGVPSDQA
jgi:hypothetical protein